MVDDNENTGCRLENMKCDSGWNNVLNAARITRGSPITDIEPSTEWKKRALISEHSPIRRLIFSWQWVNLPYFSSVHISRHKIGIEHFVQSQRKNRDIGDIGLQDAPVIHACTANAQAILAISRKRLCNKTNTETTSAWIDVIAGLYAIGEHELVQCCVPECAYRGFCPEMDKNCFANHTDFIDMYNMFLTDVGVPSNRSK